MADDGARTRALVDAFVKDLHGCGSLEQQARRLARDHALAYRSGTRYLALAAARDTARSMRFGIRDTMKRARKDSTRADTSLEYVMDASPWIGDERLAEAHRDARTAEKTYVFYATASGQLRRIIRAIDRDLAAERARGAPRTLRIAQRLVELDVRLTIQDASHLRRQHWSALDALSHSTNPGRARLRYAVRALLRRDR